MKPIEVVYAGILEGHKDSIYALVPGEAQNIVYSAGGDGMVVRWDLEKRGAGELVAQLPAAIYSLLYFKDSHIIWAGTRIGALYILDLDKHEQKAVIELKGDVFDLGLIPEAGLVTAASSGGYLYEIDESRYEIMNEVHPTQSHARALAYSLRLKQLASGWSDGMIRIYNMPHFREVQFIEAHSPSVFALAYTGDGQKLISGGRDAQIRVWGTGLAKTDMGSEQIYTETEKIPAHLFTVNHIIQIPDLGLMVSASRDKTVKIWNAETFHLLKVIDRSKLPAHTHSVNKLLFTGFNNYLLSAGDDKTIRIWGIIC